MSKELIQWMETWGILEKNSTDSRFKDDVPW